MKRKKTTDVDRTASFFNDLGDRYVLMTKNEYASIYRHTVSVISPHLSGAILDIGSGGVDLFKGSAWDKWISYDISSSLLKRHGNIQGRDPVCGEAVKLPFKNGFFDGVLAHFSLHHFAQTSAVGTFHYIEDCLSEIARVMKPNGELFIAENTIPFRLEKLQAKLYFGIRYLCLAFKRPPVYLFSAPTLKAFLLAAGFTSRTLCTFRTCTKALVLPFFIPRILNPITIAVYHGERR